MFRAEQRYKVIIDKVLSGSVTSGKYRESSRRIDNEIEVVESPNMHFNCIMLEYAFWRKNLMIANLDFAVVAAPIAESDTLL